MMSLVAVLGLAAGVFGQRLTGALVVSGKRLPKRVERVLEVLPLTIIAGVVALSAGSDQGELTLGPRAAGLAVAAVCAWRKMPMFVVVIAAAGTTALLRALG